MTIVFYQVFNAKSSTTVLCGNNGQYLLRGKTSYCFLDCWSMREESKAKKETMFSKLILCFIKFLIQTLL